MSGLNVNLLRSLSKSHHILDISRTYSGLVLLNRCRTNQYLSLSFNNTHFNQVSFFSNPPPIRIYPKNPKSKSPPKKPNKFLIVQTAVDTYFKGEVINFSISNILPMIKSATEKNSKITINAHIPKIIEYLETSPEIFSSKEMCNLLHGLSTCKVVVPDHLNRLISAITKRFHQATEVCSMVDISMALFGLKYLKSDNKQVRKLLEVLTAKLADCEEVFSARAVGCSMYGLQNMSSEYAEVRQLLKVLIPKVLACSEPLNNQAISSSLFGLNSMRSDCEETRLLLHVMKGKVESGEELLNSQAIGNALFGLQGMSSEYDEVRKLLNTLAAKVESCTDSLTALAISNVLYGMQSMDSESTEVLQFLATLLPKVEACSDKFKSKSMSNAIFGFQNMTSDCGEVLQLIKALTLKLRLCDETFKAQEIRDTLFGLQNMSSDHEEVRQFVKALVPKIKSCQERLKAKQVGDMLYSLQSMSSSYDRVRSLVKAVTVKVSECHQPLKTNDVANAFYGLQNMNSNDEEVRQLLQTLELKIESYTTTDEPVLDMRALSIALYGLRGKVIPVYLVVSLEKSITRILQQVQSSASPSFVANNNTTVTSTTNVELDKFDVLRLYQSLVLNCFDDGSSSSVNSTNQQPPVTVSEADNNVSTSSTSFISQLSVEGQYNTHQLKSTLLTIIESPDMQKQVKYRMMSRSKKMYVIKVEQELKLKYKAKFQSDRAVLDRNVILHGFECDIVLRIINNNNNNTSGNIDEPLLVSEAKQAQEQQPICNELVINYEIDKSRQSDSVHKMKRFCRLRDEYLDRMRNVMVLRSSSDIFREAIKST